MKICIFCSANSNLDPDYFEMTRQHNLHEWPAEYSVSSVSQRPEREPEGDDLPDEGE